MVERREKYLFVASTGGHLAQLVRLSVAMSPSDESLWVTFRSPQSEHLLEGRRTLWVPYVRSRDLVGVIRAWRHIRRALAQESFDRAASTGAALALAGLPAARLRGIPALYVESVSRVRGPSLTGRILALTRVAELRTQHAGWADRRWTIHPSVFGMFKSTRGVPHTRPSLFVSLGTIRGYRFDALVDAVLSTGLADERTVWQLGDTSRTGLPGSTFEQIGTETFRRLAMDADVVITHAGVGTILDLLDRGVFPVVVPRRRERNEHVDDHQEQIAELASRIGVARSVEADALSAADLIEASSMTVHRIEEV